MTTAQLSEMKTAIVEAAHLIGGESVKGTKLASVINPATEETLTFVPGASAREVDEAMRAAQSALLPLGRRGIAARRQLITEIADVIEANADLLSAVLSLETGKPPMGAGFEVKGAVMHARYWAHAEIPVDVLYDDESQRVTLERFPVGVVAAIVPWNGPLLMLVNKLACALLLGNTVVAKPSPYTPLATLVLGGLIREVAPPGTVNIVAGDDEVGAAMVAHPATNLISFTGSARAGAAIAQSAARDLKRVCLELGGNDAAIVLPDVDLDSVVPKLYRGAFAGSGQICVAIKRLFVHSAIYAPVLERLADLATAAKVGGPSEPDVTMGPLTTKPQFERVCELVADALDSGGKAVTGGAPLDRPGYFFPPTLITEAGPGTRLVDEEQFGPALPVMSFEDVEDAITAANSTDYGLGGSIWTSDVETGLHLARQLESGSAWVNRHPAVGPDLPFGGVKKSGLGRENGLPGLDHYSELKTVSVDLT